MAFCSKCGARLEDTDKFCPSCGASKDETNNTAENTAAGTASNDAGSAAGANGAAGAQAGNTGGTAEDDLVGKIKKLNDTADTTSDFDRADIDKNKGMSIVAYLSWLVLIPLIAAPGSKYARFHSNQGLVLAIAEVAWWIAASIVTAVFSVINYRLGMLFSAILNLANIAFLVLTIIGIINAADGRAKELPIIGKIKLLK